MTYVTFAIVGIFFLLNLPRMLVGGYEVSVTWLILHCVEARFEYLPNLTFYRWDAVSRYTNMFLSFMVAAVDKCLRQSYCIPNVIIILLLVSGQCQQVVIQYIFVVGQNTGHRSS